MYYSSISGIYFFFVFSNTAKYLLETFKFIKQLNLERIGIFRLIWNDKKVLPLMYRLTNDSKKLFSLVTLGKNDFEIIIELSF